MSTKRFLKVQVGEEWPDGIKLNIEASPRSVDRNHARNTLMLGTAAALILLLATLTVYGALYSESLLNRVFDLVENGLLLLWGAVFGRPRLKDAQ